MKQSHLKNKVQALLEQSRKVFYDCLLPNGCLVAAPSHMPYYPAQAKSYLYCWPGRDLGFNLWGADILGIEEKEQIFKWIWERAENFKKAPEHLSWQEGLLLRSYHPNGRIREGAFQPDQTGTLLWVIAKFNKQGEAGDLALEIIKKGAEGLARLWTGTHFKVPVEDLWEERLAHPRFKTNLTYSLAACSAGLFEAAKIFENEGFRKASLEMKYFVDQAFDVKCGFFLRRTEGEIGGDYNVDASLLGLAFPFGIVGFNSDRYKKTVRMIEKKLKVKEGLKRYQFDEFEGEIETGFLHYKQGAGAWPLLSFWFSIVLSKMGNKNEAEEYFWSTVDQIGEDNLIPEQIFPEGDKRVGVKPLLWSHMMFVIAAEELGVL